MFWDYMGAGSAVVRCCVWVMNVDDWEGSGFGCRVYLWNAMDYFFILFRAFWGSDLICTVICWSNGL